MEPLHSTRSEVVHTPSGSAPAGGGERISQYVCYRITGPRLPRGLTRVTPAHASHAWAGLGALDAALSSETVG